MSAGEPSNATKRMAEILGADFVRDPTKPGKASAPEQIAYPSTCYWCSSISSAAEHYAGGGVNLWHVECNNSDCQATGPRCNTRAAAITAWNSRAAETPTCNPDRFAGSAGEQIVVTQADRERAADLFEYLGGSNKAALIRKGHCDHYEEVQAFARHRIAATRASDARIAGMMEVHAELERDFAALHADYNRAARLINLMRERWHAVSNELDHIEGGMFAGLEDAASAMATVCDDPTAALATTKATEGEEG